ncbi:cell division protein FtsL [Pelagibacterium mangrovi]|uniref:cell division protein FtsL n=1 Tax=Pelagibacterium mangrovi TaxID=3119828 RepID=UPI002FCC4F02
MSWFLHRLNIILGIIAVIAVVAVYSQKHMAELTAEEIGRIESAIAKQQADLSILKADWAYLNQPTHIQPIVDRHNDVLNLQVAKVEQFGSFSDLPMRPQQRLDTDALDALFETIEAGEDPIGSLLEGLL